MKQLDFTLSLIDKLSRPLKQVQNNVTGFAEKSTAAFTKIGGGVLALAGTGMTIKGALSPAIEMYDALNEAAAKGIDDSALKTVQRDALTFSTTSPGGDISFLTSQAAIATRCQRRSAAFSLLRHSEPPLKKIVCTAGRWRVTAWPKKSFADQNRTTPHPPAVFGS